MCELLDPNHEEGHKNSVLSLLGFMPGSQSRKKKEGGLLNTLY